MYFIKIIISKIKSKNYNEIKLNLNVFFLKNIKFEIS